MCRRRRRRRRRYHYLCCLPIILCTLICHFKFFSLQSHQRKWHMYNYVGDLDSNHGPLVSRAIWATATWLLPSNLYNCGLRRDLYSNCQSRRHLTTPTAEMLQELGVPTILDENRLIQFFASVICLSGKATWAKWIKLKIIVNYKSAYFEEELDTW